MSDLKSIYYKSGTFTLALRLVVGWTYFSAFWRRTVLVDKLDPEVAGYIGEKFNHFLPNALFIKPIIEYLVTTPDVLWLAMVVFTIVEGIVGLLIMFGLFTRLMSIGVFGLAMGILLGSGWIGTTCLDEWQIGVLGIATGFTLFLSGGGYYSLDYYLDYKGSKIASKKWFKFLGSQELPIAFKKLSKITLFKSLGILFLTLFTNQVFHGGVWGDLHNKSVKPKLEISAMEFNNNQISFDVFRVEGADVYGSFLIGISILNKQEELVLHLDQTDLSNFDVNKIDNYYVAKIKPHANSLLIPLGAKAKIILENETFAALEPGEYQLKLTDISGASWSLNFEV